MARVPLSVVPDVGVSPTPPSDYQSIPSSAANFGGLTAQAEQRFGAQAQEAGQNLDQVALLQQQRFNQIAGDDAMNDFMDRGERLTYGTPGDPTNPGLYNLKGAAALSQGPQVVTSLKDLRDNISKGLQNDAQRLQFDEQSRRYFQYKSAEISRHLSQQADVYGQHVNEAGLKLAEGSAGNTYNSDDAIMHSLADAQQFADKNAGLINGPNPDPKIVEQGQVEARTRVVRSAVAGALAANDPSRAAQILDKFGGLIDPVQRETLNRATKGTADQSTVAATINSIMAGTGGAAAAPMSLHDAIRGQEGSGPNQVSHSGAVGSWQVTPGFFQKYARPGESFSNETDRATVAQRGIDALSQEYNGDVARVAVAYFSGEGNVAPPGSPTPWKVDRDDGSPEHPGTKVSQYVRGVLARMGASAGQSQPYVIGDSLAAGIQAVGGYGGGGQVGAKPQQVFTNINSVPDAEIQGRNVVLSTGVSNAPDQIGLVSQQIALLKQKGAANVTVVGVGNRADLNPLNAQLAQIAQQSGASFAAVDPSTLGPDHVHPADYRSLAQVAAGGAASAGPAAATHTPEAFGWEQQKMAQARAAAFQAFPNDPRRQKEIIDGVWQEIQQANVLQQKYEAEQAKARRDAQSKVMNDAITTITEDPTKFDLNSINAKDSAGGYLLEPQQREALIEFQKKQLAEHGIENTAPYGPGYAKAYSGIFAPAGSPDKINDLNDILRRGGPGGDLTSLGVQKLAQVFQASRKSPDENALHRTELSMIQYAKSHLSFEEDTGLVKIRDPKGEAIFNAQFVPKFEAGLSAAKATGDPQKVWDYLSQENVDKLMQGMRNPAQMAADRMAASGQLTPADVDKPEAPLPPVPKLTAQNGQPPTEISPYGWEQVMRGPLPVAENKQPFTHAAWAEYLRRLMQNPDEHTIKKFDEHFGMQGFSGAEIIKQLQAKPPVNTNVDPVTGLPIGTMTP